MASSTSPAGFSREIFRAGKLPAQRDYRTLEFSKYLMTLQGPPDTGGLRGDEKVAWSSFYNEIFKCCVPAAMLNLQQAWVHHDGGSAAPWDDAAALELYARMSEFRFDRGELSRLPDPPWSDSPGGRQAANKFAKQHNDNGVALLSALKFWDHPSDHSPVGAYGLFAFASCEPRSTEQIATAVWLFGGALVGLRLPLTASTTEVQDVWSVPPGGPVAQGAPGSWQSHCLAAVGYNRYGLLAVAWGRPQHLTWEFLKAYADEVYVPLPNVGASEGDPRPVLDARVDFPWDQVRRDRERAEASYPPINDDEYGGKGRPHSG